jgi:PPK2 family polyphosphate:nucleotide phosphotransferase
MDTGGKDGVIKDVFKGVNPIGLSIASFKTPTSTELAHDFLWRVHHEVPAKGYIGIFNRSHYEDVLVVRVNHLVHKSVWKARYDHINNFERLLTDGGTRVIKFYLNITKDEQKERLQARLDDQTKHWKFSKGDLPVREQWDDYMAAYQDALTKCNTEEAPWVVVPSNKKWFRNVVVAQTLVETLESMKLSFPKPEEDLSDVVIPD